MRASPLLLAVVLLPLAACGGRPAPPAPARVLTAADHLYYDNTGGIQDSLRLVIRDPQRFQQIWTRATSTQVTPPPAPAIDFSKWMVVVVDAGRRNIDDEIRVDSAAFHERTTVQGKKERVLDVTVVLRQGCGGLNASGYPLEIVRLPAFAGKVQFVERTVPASGCGGGSQPPARAPGPERQRPGNG